MAQGFCDGRATLGGLQIPLTVFVSIFALFSLCELMWLKAYMQRLFFCLGLLNEENPFEEFSTDSESALVISPVSSNTSAFIERK